MRRHRTNADRVAEVNILMDQFSALRGVDPSPDADGPDAALGELLAHLMHWADAKNVIFDEALVDGESHFRAELEDEA